jgi:hypothetical protein
MRNLSEYFDDITAQYRVREVSSTALDISEVWFRVEYSGQFMGWPISDYGYYTADKLQREILPWLSRSGLDWSAQRVY